MSETRTVYNVTMQPGRELDELVAEVMGNKLSYTPDYSTRISPAMEAWAWLEENHPWRTPWGDKADISLSRGRVYIDQSGPNGLADSDHTRARPGHNFYIQGETYPHAIALAVVEAGKTLE